MKTKLLHSYGKYDIKEYDWDKPEPTDDQIEVKAQLTGICRSDIDMVVGKFGPLPFGMFGHEGLGQVTKVGKNLDNIFVGDYVATRADAAYAYYYNATKEEFVQVPECDPKYILEPVACALNIAYNISSEAWRDEKILILGSGFLATIVWQYLKRYVGTDVTVVGNANYEYWCKEGVTLHKSIVELEEKFKVIIDLSTKPNYFEHDVIDNNAVVIQAAEKSPAITTNFSTYLWKNVTLIFPSPRDTRFHESMLLARTLIGNDDLDVNDMWSQAYSRDNFEQAFTDGISRPYGYSRGYIDWRL